MKYNKLQHMILGALNKKSFEYQMKMNNEIFISFDELCLICKCNMEKLNIIIAELFTNEEVQLFDRSNGKGLVIAKNGISAYSSKKYIKQRIDFILQRTKDFSLLIFGVIGTVISVYTAISSANNKAETSKEIKTLTLKISTLEYQLLKESRRK